MTKRTFGLRVTAAALLLSVWLVPMAAFSQTQITLPKNKYSPQDDVKLGNEAAAQVEQQFPLIRDADAAAYIERVGERLVAAIPPQFNQPAFHYRFKWVNASDLNAFALPGGPMYINRGMIEKAHNEGEMAGVMAHEISHVVLRHATAQATKQSSAKSQIGQLGMILGGAVLGGQAGAQLGALGAQAWTTKYSREYESQADTLGAQIMAAAGYDPQDLANVFRTIQGESRGGSPAWLSSHPDPGNRYQKISQEAALLRVSSNPLKVTPGFQRTQARFRNLPPAPSMAEIEKNPGRYASPEIGPQGGTTGTQNGGQFPTDNGSGGNYSTMVERPSTSLRSFTDISWLQMSLPSNWNAQKTGNSIEFAPAGAAGEQGITHGVMIGVRPAQRRPLDQTTTAYINEVLQNNDYLTQQGGLKSGALANRNAFAATLAGVSPVTGQTELVTVYTMQLKSGEVFFVATVVPEKESSAYNATFRSVLGSIKLND
jgi:Zn-dependent protease with chaperone function